MHAHINTVYTLYSIHLFLLFQHNSTDTHITQFLNKLFPSLHASASKIFLWWNRIRICHLTIYHISTSSQLRRICGAIVRSIKQISHSNDHLISRSIEQDITKNIQQALTQAPGPAGHPFFTKWYNPINLYVNLTCPKVLGKATVRIREDWCNWQWTLLSHQSLQQASRKLSFRMENDKLSIPNGIILFFPPTFIAHIGEVSEQSSLQKISLKKTTIC